MYDHYSLNMLIILLASSFSLVRDLIHKANHRPFIKRYLKRDDFLRQISECDQSLVDVLGMFSVSLP